MIQVKICETRSIFFMSVDEKSKKHRGHAMIVDEALCHLT